MNIRNFLLNTSLERDPKFYSGLLSFIFIIIILISIFSCSSVKKSNTNTKEKETKSRDSIYIRLTKTVYTDTGSTVTYYRDSVVFLHDTAIQLVDKIINHYNKNKSVNDSEARKIHDTLTLIRTTKETIKTKDSLPIWFWLIVGLASLVLIISLLKKICL